MPRGQAVRAPCWTPGRNERIAYATPGTETVSLSVNSDSLDGIGMAESGCGPGCLARRALKGSSETCAISSSEQASLTAPFRLPSSIFTETFLAKDSKGSLGLVVLR